MALVEELNHFCMLACFEVKKPEAAIVQTSYGRSSPSLMVQEYEVRCTLRAVNPWKVTSPDGVTRRVLKEYADQLAGVFTKIFKASLSQSCILLCLKSATVVPLPKQTTISSLNDFLLPSAAVSETFFQTLYRELEWVLIFPQPSPSTPALHKAVY